MRIVQYFFVPLLLLGLLGCGSDDIHETTGDGGGTVTTPSPYLLYYCAHIGIGNTDSRAGIYGIKKSGETYTIETVVDLDGKSLDSCTMDQSGHFYWGDRDAHVIYKSDAHGANPTAIVHGLDIPYRGLAIDPTTQRLYWSNWRQSDDPQTGEVVSSDLAGSNRTTLMTSLKSGGSLTLDTAHRTLYVSDLFGDRIIKADLDGSNQEQVATTSQPHQTAINPQGGYLIWQDRDQDGMHQISLTDSSIQDPFASENTFGDIRTMTYDTTNGDLYYFEYADAKLHLYRYHVPTHTQTKLLEIRLTNLGGMFMAP